MGPARFLARETIEIAIRRLFGTADHLLKIWFTLKQMGMAEGADPVLVTTSSPDEALKRLFSYGNPSGEFFLPFAHTPRFMTMRGDAGRSIIQTTIQRWKTSGSVVTCDPTSFLDITTDERGQLLVRPGRSYPIGLGWGNNGFALEDSKRVTLPGVSFACWYFRQTPIEEQASEKATGDYLINRMRAELNISSAEFEAIFVSEQLKIATSSTRITDKDLFTACNLFISHPVEPITTALTETFEHHSQRVRSMKTITDRPQWLNAPPVSTLKSAVAAGAKAIVLYGPPRTGKTKAIDDLFKRGESSRETIQIHDGWGYDHLIQGFRPDAKEGWAWIDGPLKKAIESGKKVIVLEEINRTNLTQALGEVFSLIEEAYRGKTKSVRLRNGDPFFVPEDTLFLMTMNTLDKSTEDIDDALMGRFAAVAFPPRVEDLTSLLEETKIDSQVASKLRELFTLVQEYYPLGHGYFANLTTKSDVLAYYVTRIRPVLENHFRDYKPEVMDLIDNKFDSLFGSSGK